MMKKMMMALIAAVVLMLACCLQSSTAWRLPSASTSRLSSRTKLGKFLPAVVMPMSPTSSGLRLYQSSLTNNQGGNDELDLPQWIQTTNKLTITIVKSCLQLIYGDRHYARFAALETIARVPYFSYTSVLHLYETLGWFRKKEYIQIHFAESWNELHHLLIMESLGGNDNLMDRLVAQHIAFFYYWIVIAIYLFNPAIAYDLNKHVEQHAYESYDKFIKEHESELKAQPAPAVAIDYYEKGDLYMFDAFQYNEVNRKSNPEVYGEPSPRRPVVQSLYDVFCNIRADEKEHSETMRILQRKSTSLQLYNEDDHVDLPKQ